MKKSIFFKNTMIILITSLIIKALGLLNKIIITRLLGPDGMSIYILTFPTVMLLISISGLSLNISTSKLIAESIKHHKYSPKKLIKNSILLSLLVSLITIVALLIIIKPLTIHLLKNEKLFYPILASIFLIPLVGISDCLRGYFNGLKDMKTSSISTLIEQIARISFSVIFIIITIPYGPVISTVFCIISLSIGEIGSIIYTLIKIKKFHFISYPNTGGETKAILNIAIPTTLGRLIGSLTCFLEPIFYTFILIKLSYPNNDITSTYTTVNAYVLPILTMTSFVSYSLATAIIPGISESVITNDLHSIHYYIQKTIIFSLLPALVTSVIFFNYSKEYIYFLYGTTNGSLMVKYSVFLIIPYYLQMPYSSILHALGKSKQVFIISCVLDLFRLILIIILAFVPIINLHSLLVATITTIIMTFFIEHLLIKKTTKYKINKANFFSLLIVFFLGLGTSRLLKALNVHFIIASIIIVIIFFISSLLLKLISLNNFKELYLTKLKKH